MPNDPLYGLSEIVESMDAPQLQSAAAAAILVLYRACNQQDAFSMRDSMSAGGAPLDESCGPPDPARDPFVGFIHQDPSAALCSSARANWGVEGAKVWIRRRYVVWHDVSGWCARPQAPIERWEHFRFGVIESRSASTIQDAGPDDIIILYRGCNQQDADRMRDARSAGGALRDPHCQTPTEGQVRAQVGEGMAVRQPDGTYVRPKLPEFTHSRDNVMMRRVVAPGVVMGTAKVWIRRRYLVRGDAGIMEGWCARHEAPIEKLEFIRR